MREWLAFTHKLEQELGSEVVNTWIKPLKVVHFDARNLYLEGSSCFQIDWFEEHVRPRLAKEFITASGKKIAVHLGLQEEKKAPPPPKKAWKPQLDLKGDGLDPKATFESFLASKTNAITVKLLQDILDKKENYNPIFLSGPSSSGKTHLLMAATFYLQAKGLSCFYVRGDNFTAHLVAAIQNGAMQKFRELYRKADCLLIDDIDILAGRSASQEELFHTFNTLHAAGKPILLSAKTLPSALEGIEPRLTSRFEWGIVLTLHPLTSQEKPDLVAMRLKAADFPLPEVTREWLILHFPSSPANLLRALDALLLRAHLSGLKPEMLTPEKVEPILAKLLVEEERAELSLEKIIERVSSHYRVTPQDILGKKQTQECAYPRKIAIYLARRELKLPFKHIAKALSRDHSTIMSAVEDIEARIARKEERPLEALRALLLA